MGTKQSSGVFYAPFIPGFLQQEIVESKSRQLKASWSFEQQPPVILHGYEVYVLTPMDESVRIELSNIPFKFKLNGWDLAMWSISRSMQSEITKEIDKDIVEALTKAYK